jgi:hypothetical protein
MCNCKEEEKTGTTTVMCCNICGMPDDPSWSVNQWISVEDRLPEINKDVLIYWECEYLDRSIDEVLEVASLNNDGTWFKNFPDYEITHWMPLPQPPESILNNVYISEVKR